jgi:hypothetical protein
MNKYNIPHMILVNKPFMIFNLSIHQLLHKYKLSTMYHKTLSHMSRNTRCASQEVSMMNILALYFYRSNLYRISHVATSLSRENTHCHSSCIHQNPTIHRNNTYLLNQWMDLMYLSTLNLPGSLIS